MLYIKTLQKLLKIYKINFVLFYSPFLAALGIVKTSLNPNYQMIVRYEEMRMQVSSPLAT